MSEVGYCFCVFQRAGRVRYALVFWGGLASPAASMYAHVSVIVGMCPYVCGNTSASRTKQSTEEANLQPASRREKQQRGQGRPSAGR